MSRKLTSRSSLDGLKREAKRWLKALREHDAEALARFARAHPTAPPDPGLRHVQHALAREYGFDGWSALTQALPRIGASARDEAIQALLLAAVRGEADRVRALLEADDSIVNE